MNITKFGFAALPLIAFAGSAQAADVTFAGAVANTCVLTIPTPGTLALSSDGTTLGSQEGPADTPATLTVVATGTAPTLNWSAPSVSTPIGALGDSTEVAYTSIGSGASQAYTSSPTTSSSNLIDTFTVNSRVNASTGFTDGVYTVTVTVTCSQ